MVAYRKTEIIQYHEVIYADVTRHLIDNATNTLAGGLGGPDGVVACTARALQNLPLTPIEDLARGVSELVSTAAAGMFEVHKSPAHSTSVAVPLPSRRARTHPRAHLILC